VTGSIQPEIYTKILRNLSQKLGAKFPPTTRISHLGILELKANPEAVKR